MLKKLAIAIVSRLSTLEDYLSYFLASNFGKSFVDHLLLELFRCKNITPHLGFFANQIQQANLFNTDLETVLLQERSLLGLFFLRFDYEVNNTRVRTSSVVKKRIWAFLKETWKHEESFICSVYGEKDFNEVTAFEKVVKAFSIDQLQQKFTVYIAKMEQMKAQMDTETENNILTPSRNLVVQSSCLETGNELFFQDVDGDADLVQQLQNEDCAFAKELQSAGNLAEQAVNGSFPKAKRQKMVRKKSRQLS